MESGERRMSAGDMQNFSGRIFPRGQEGIPSDPGSTVLHKIFNRACQTMGCLCAQSVRAFSASMSEAFGNMALESNQDF